MESAKNVGRMVGVMLLVHLAGLIVPFILLLPIARPDFLENAAEFSFQIKTAVFLLFLNGALTLGIAITGWPIFRRHSERTALWLLFFSIIWFVMQAVDNVHLLAMLSLSQRYAETGGPEDLFRTLAATVSSTRKWAHYTELLIIDTWIFMLYGLFFRFALVPRALAAFALLTVALHTTGITIPLFLDYGMVTLMGASMALGHVGLAGWLMVKGFGESGIAQRNAAMW